MHRTAMSLCVVLLFMAAGAGAEIGPRPAPEVPNDGSDPAFEPPRSVIEHFARSLAVAMKDPEVRRMVHRHVGKKFDGDHNVLYRDLANQRLPDGTTFRTRLAQGAARSTEQEMLRSKVASVALLDAYTTALPRLQVAVPVHYESWDPESFTPLVAFLPLDVDDMEMEEVRAFDSQGRRHVLDAWVEPSVPVVVVGLNERTDENGFLKARQTEICPESFSSTCSEGGGDAGGGGDGSGSSVCDPRTHSYGDREILYQIEVFNTHEPWTRGSPDIKAVYSLSGDPDNSFTHPLSNVDDENTVYTVNDQLFYWQQGYGDILAMAIWEEDTGSTITVSYEFFGVNFELQVKDGDDELGSAPVHFDDPNCGEYDVGDARFVMRHAAP